MEITDTKNGEFQWRYENHEKEPWGHPKIEKSNI